MDSARVFDLLGESVPQVRVSARALALLGFFSLIYIYIYILFELLGGRSSQPSDWLPFGQWRKCQSVPLRGVRQEYV